MGWGCVGPPLRGSPKGLSFLEIGIYLEKMHTKLLVFPYFIKGNLSGLYRFYLTVASVRCVDVSSKT